MCVNQVFTFFIGKMDDYPKRHLTIFDIILVIIHKKNKNVIFEKWLYQFYNEDIQILYKILLNDELFFQFFNVDTFDNKLEFPHPDNCNCKKINYNQQFLEKFGQIKNYQCNNDIVDFLNFKNDDLKQAHVIFEEIKYKIVKVNDRNVKATAKYNDDSVPARNHLTRKIINLMDNTEPMQVSPNLYFKNLIKNVVMKNNGDMINFQKNSSLFIVYLIFYFIKKRTFFKRELFENPMIDDQRSNHRLKLKYNELPSWDILYSKLMDNREQNNFNDDGKLICINKKNTLQLINDINELNLDQFMIMPNYRGEIIQILYQQRKITIYDRCGKKKKLPRWLSTKSLENRDFIKANGELLLMAIIDSEEVIHLFDIRFWCVNVSKLNQGERFQLLQLFYDSQIINKENIKIVQVLKTCEDIHTFTNGILDNFRSGGNYLNLKHNGLIFKAINECNTNNNYKMLFVMPTIRITSNLQLYTMLTNDLANFKQSSNAQDDYYFEWISKPRVSLYFLAYKEKKNIQLLLFHNFRFIKFIQIKLNSKIFPKKCQYKLYNDKKCYILKVYFRNRDIVAVVPANYLPLKFCCSLGQIKSLSS